MCVVHWLRSDLASWHDVQLSYINALLNLAIRMQQQLASYADGCGAGVGCLSLSAWGCVCDRLHLEFHYCYLAPVDIRAVERVIGHLGGSMVYTVISGLVIHCSMHPPICDLKGLRAWVCALLSARLVFYCVGRHCATQFDTVCVEQLLHCSSNSHPVILFDTHFTQAVSFQHSSCLTRLVLNWGRWFTFDTTLV